MSRIVIELPDHFTYQTEIPVRITDINYGNHLGHDSFLSLLHEARVRMLADHGFSEIDIGGCGIIMADTGIVFKSEVFYPATLSFELAVTNCTRSSFDVFYRVTQATGGSAVAEAKTGMVCFDYERKRPARMPEAFRSAFDHKSMEGPDP